MIVPPSEPHVSRGFPGFSVSTAKVLLARSPLHARYASKKEPTPEMDRGSILHRLLLGKGAGFEVVDADNWRTKVAQEKRDAARAAGLIPVLAREHELYDTAAARIRAGLLSRGVKLDGESEYAIEWEEYPAHGTVHCRAMLDYVWPERGQILDLKITENAGPEAVERMAENFGYAIQAAAYTRALVSKRPEFAGRVDFLFAFCEPDPPYDMNIVRPSGAFRELGLVRWTRAVATWARCVREDTWPGVAAAINTISPPSWALAREGITPDEEPCR